MTNMKIFTQIYLLKWFTLFKYSPSSIQNIVGNLYGFANLSLLCTYKCVEFAFVKSKEIFLALNFD